MTQQPIKPSCKPKVGKSLWRRLLKWTFRVIVVLLVIAAITWGIFNYSSAKALEDELSKIQAAGQPLTFTQLDQSLPKISETDDAAPYYKAAMALHCSSIDKRVADLLDKLKNLAQTRETTIHPEVAAEIESVLAANALSLEMIDRGSQRAQCAYNFGLSNGIAVMLPQLSDARALARVLSLRTLWLAQQGLTSEAAASFISSLRIWRMFDHQPVLITYLAKVACTAFCVDSLPTVLEAGRLSDQELAKLELALADVDQSLGMQRVFLAERVYMLELWRNLIVSHRRLELGDAPNLPDTAPPSNFLSRPMFRMMMVRQLQMYDQYIYAAGKKWPECMDAMRAYKQPSAGVFALFNQILAPAFDRAMVILGRTVGSLRSAEVAVMVERYRLANGRLPKSLYELRQFTGIDLPADPFTGRDLVFKAQTDTFMVYSVGDDRSDDGGPLRQPQKDWGVSMRLLLVSMTTTSQAN
ncbi:MAG: hypothetical protein HQ546_10710 [Planctomycetes bacterium]|nr:hypothetical protein [Planctomycetota bacterium]